MSTEAERLRTVEQVADMLETITPTFHAVVAGQHLDNCIACVILGILRVALGGSDG